MYNQEGHAVASETQCGRTAMYPHNNQQTTNYHVKVTEPMQQCRCAGKTAVSCTESVLHTSTAILAALAQAQHALPCDHTSAEALQSGFGQQSDERNQAVAPQSD